MPAPKPSKKRSARNGATKAKVKKRPSPVRKAPSRAAPRQKAARRPASRSGPRAPQRPASIAPKIARTGKAKTARQAKGQAPPKRAPSSEPAVLVVGDHPAASLCALLLHEAGTPVALLDIGTTPNADRLITLNPAFFDLDKSLRPLRDSLKLTPITQLRFLGPDGESAHSRPPRGDGFADAQVVAYVASMREIRDAMRAAAIDAGVPQLRGALAARDIDDRGVHVSIAQEKFVPALLAVADPLPDEAANLLDVPRFPGRGSGIQATAKLTGAAILGPNAQRHVLAMTLDLGRQLNWGWLLCRGSEVQICVQCPPEADVPALMEEWTQVLKRHEVLAPEAQPALATLKAYDLPLGGALMRDVVARRTLLLGPAGGFYSASGEDVYPGCWSAKFAAEVAARAAKAAHPQDALGAYRGRWGSTLGDYLRGPQQNLRFLLPLVYKNPVMTQRLAEAILLGESLVK